MNIPETPALIFDDYMRRAQTLHSKGHYGAAKDYWQEAAGVMQDSPLELGRAIRGNASSTFKQGGAELEEAGIAKARLALSLHQELYTDPQNQPPAQEVKREYAVSSGTLGSLLLSQTVTQEITTELTPEEARNKAAKALELLNSALEVITVVENGSSHPDQYRINFGSRAALGHALYGKDQNLAKTLGYQSFIQAMHSEDTHLPTKAGISPSYDIRAKARAIPRGYAALFSSYIATPEASARRTVVLHIAGNKYVGI